ncbi:hypothetical protein QQP08_019683 [Theobroma cacao]|nr:hypothetical protein QQP08_019683 [Theobroma cacao]
MALFISMIYKLGSGYHAFKLQLNGLVHIYDLQTGQWVSGFQVAADTVNGFSIHPFLPMATTSSGHRRFQMPEDDNEDLHLRGDENCASVWSFSYDFTAGEQC